MAAIGFFDSGVGGVTVMKEARSLLPQEDFVYYGDTVHAPYGTRTPDDIRSLTLAGVRVLEQHHIKALVIACNTATSAAAETLRSICPYPVIGIEPALKPAHALLRQGHIVVLATAATLSLPKFGSLMERFGEKTITVPGTGLVELIEQDRQDSPECEALLRSLLPSCPIDAIVLGCTHFVFLRPLLSRLCPGIPVLDGHHGTAKQLAHVLREKCLCENGQGSTVFLSSGDRAALSLMRDMYDRLILPTDQY